MAAEFLDRFSRGNTICHRLSPAFKLGLFALFLLATFATPVEFWPLHGCLVCLVLAGYSLARIPWGYLTHRVLWFLPVLLMFTVTWRGGAEQSSLLATLLIRSLISFLAGLWLVNVTPFEQLLVLMRKLWVPTVLVAILAFMYRYAFVVFDELDRMRQARLARQFGKRRWWTEIRVAASLLGMLLIRSLQRAERVHGAMCARGWDGQVRSLQDDGQEKVA